MADRIGRLEGKVALVTGSPMGGIGGAISDRFAAEGARVMRHDKKPEAAQTEEVDFFIADLTDPTQCVALVEETVRRFGRLDILVNNAALTTRSTIETTDAAFFDTMMAVNLRAPMLLIQAALPHFRAGGGGVVLNIGSVNGHGGGGNLLDYSLSKGGLMTLSRNLADALGSDHIRVNHFNVGWVLSESEQRLQESEGQPADWAERVSFPSGRLLLPEEIANFAVTFVEDHGGPVSGAVVDLNQHGRKR
jgi:NAD(P)-dependent dehydrogenase (short-subunit alcohol dehydrogenase family)